jgi:hypothetical protein
MIYESKFDTWRLTDKELEKVNFSTLFAEIVITFNRHLTIS